MYDDHLVLFCSVWFIYLFNIYTFYNQSIHVSVVGLG